jgi:hypothetical protein
MFAVDLVAPTIWFSQPTGCQSTNFTAIGRFGLQVLAWLELTAITPYWLFQAGVASAPPGQRSS